MGNSLSNPVQINGNGEILLPKKYLRILKSEAPDFSSSVVFYKSTDLARIESNWNQITLKKDHNQHQTSTLVGFYNFFYENLFQTDPAMKKIFRHSAVVQTRALINIVGAITTLLQSDDLIQYSTQLAARHLNYGVHVQHFNTFGNVLILALRKFSQEQWNHELELAWRRIFAYILHLMAPILIDRETEESKTKKITSKFNFIVSRK